jgi:surface polysaccharide O-acyltransferase-like enzyme
MICVPLFILLTGYLTRKKQITKDYYFKIFYTLGIYILASIACIVYRVFINNEVISLTYFIGGFFGYKNAPYSWYIEMYIGLFLLSPFLNILDNNIDSKRKKQLLVLTFIFLTSLPSIVNVYRPDLEWFLNIASSTDYAPILPDWWINIYPITYYFLGCYLNEYKINLRVRYQALILFLVIIANGSYNFYRSLNSTFIQGPWQQYYGITQVIQTVLPTVQVQVMNIPMIIMEI